jgi:hypothetical protein
MSQAERPPPEPPSALEARRHGARLRALAERLDHQAALIRNGGRDFEAEARAGRLDDEAFAIRWALRQIAPELEGPRQTLAALHAIGGSP